jgi:hypothetical protein
MTPQEKQAMLGTIEKLMNLIVSDHEMRFGAITKDAENGLAPWFRQHFPCVVWEWDNDLTLAKIKVTDFIQAEL